MSPGHAGDPRRGRRSSEEGDHGSHLSADARQDRRDRPGVPHHDLADVPGALSRRGLQILLQAQQRRPLRPLHGGRAVRHRAGTRRGGFDARFLSGGLPEADRHGVRRVRGCQDGHRAPGSRCEHRRGGGQRVRHRGGRSRRQGDDLQLRHRFEAQRARRQQDAGPARSRQIHEEQSVGDVVRRREVLCRRVRGVRRPCEEAHAVLEVPPEPGGCRRHQPNCVDRRQSRQGDTRLPSGHTVEGARREDDRDDRGGSRWQGAISARRKR